MCGLDTREPVPHAEVYEVWPLAGHGDAYLCAVASSGAIAGLSPSQTHGRCDNDIMSKHKSEYKQKLLVKDNMISCMQPVPNIEAMPIHTTLTLIMTVL